VIAPGGPKVVLVVGERGGRGQAAAVSARMRLSALM
jgi:hypothetical protein